MTEPISIGDYVRIVSQDQFHGKLGRVHYVWLDTQPDELSHLVWLSGLLCSDLVPFRRDELILGESPRMTWPACVTRREQSEVLR